MTTILFFITTSSTPNYHPQGHGQHYFQEELKGAHLATLVWTVIRSDSLCNFGDGQRLTKNLSNGFSISVAAFCRELLRELKQQRWLCCFTEGGMTVKQVVLYHPLSALLAYLGRAAGIFVGPCAADAPRRICALAAGVCMDMGPAMLYNDVCSHGRSR